MAKTDEDKINVDYLCDLWTLKQRNFEIEIKSLLDKSKKLSKQLNSKSDDPKTKTLTKQQVKLDELMIHLTEELQRRHDEASAKKRLTEWRKTLDKMRARIRVISQTLIKVGQTDKATIDKLCDAEDYTQHHYELLSQELQRCETLRTENLGTLINHLWNEIDHWSEMTLQYSLVQKYKEECCTEGFLEVLEQKLNDLQSFYNSNKTIFQLYAKRTKLWAQYEELERKAKEPSRYRNRGGKLLSEERERRHINQQLPIIEDKLSQMAMEYEQRNHKPILVFGKEMMTQITLDWEEFRAVKELQAEDRKNAVFGGSLGKQFKGSGSTYASLNSLRKSPSATQVKQNATKGSLSARQLKNNK